MFSQDETFHEGLSAKYKYLSLYVSLYEWCIVNKIGFNYCYVTNWVHSCWDMLITYHRVINQFPRAFCFERFFLCYSLFRNGTLSSDCFVVACKRRVLILIIAVVGTFPWNPSFWMWNIFKRTGWEVLESWFIYESRIEERLL